MTVLPSVGQLSVERSAVPSRWRLGAEAPLTALCFATPASPPHGRGWGWHSSSCFKHPQRLPVQPAGTPRGAKYWRTRRPQACAGGHASRAAPRLADPAIVSRCIGIDVPLWAGGARSSNTEADLTEADLVSVDRHQGFDGTCLINSQPRRTCALDAQKPEVEDQFDTAKATGLGQQVAAVALAVRKAWWVCGHSALDGRGRESTHGFTVRFVLSAGCP